MKEKGNNKIIYVVCIVLFVLTVAFGFFMYKYYDKCVILENDKTQLQLMYDNLLDEVSRSNEIDQSPKLKLGSYSFYVFNPELYSEAYTVTLNDNNDVYIYLGEGCSHKGKYEINGNELICHITEFNNFLGDALEDDVNYTFEISDNSLIVKEVSDANYNNVTNYGYEMVFPEGRVFTYNLLDSIHVVGEN